MNESMFNELREQSQRRALTPEERARVREFLAAHPEVRAAWAEDAALSRVLCALPAAPVPPNFTAQVLGQLDRPHRPHHRQHAVRFRWFGHWGFPQLATATALVALLASLATLEYRRQARAQIARSVAAASPAGDMLDAETWENFDAIRQLSQLATDVDVELLDAPQ